MEPGQQAQSPSVKPFSQLERPQEAEELLPGKSRRRRRPRVMT